MKEEKVLILYLLTPYHFKQLEHLHEMKEAYDHIFIFYSDFVGVKKVESFLKEKSAQLIPLEKIAIAFDDVLTKPYSTIKLYRRQLASFRKTMNESFKGIAKDVSIKLIYFNDKNIFFQYFVKVFLKAYLNKYIIAVDEGAGYYAKEVFVDRVKKELYKIITPFLLGFTYEYVKTYGTLGLTQKIYARFPEKLSKQFEGVEYEKLEKNHRLLPLDEKVPEKSVLIVLSPLVEDRLLSADRISEILHKIIYELEKEGFVIFLKYHPRNIRQLVEAIAKDFNCRELNVKEPIEYYDLSAFNKIVNFGSSIVIDMLARGFQMDKIITIKAIHSMETCIIFYEETKLLELEEVNNQFSACLH